MLIRDRMWNVEYYKNSAKLKQYGTTDLLVASLSSLEAVIELGELMFHHSRQLHRMKGLVLILVQSFNYTTREGDLTPL